MQGQDEVENCTPELTSRKQLFSKSSIRASSRRFTPYGRTPKSRQLKGKYTTKHLYMVELEIGDGYKCTVKLNVTSFY